VVFEINSTRNASRKGNSTRLLLVLFSPFLLALLVLLIPNTTENHAITYTNIIVTRVMTFDDATTKASSYFYSKGIFVHYS